MADEINLEINLETAAALKDLSKFQSGINKELGAVEKSLSGLKSVGAGIAAAVSAGFAAFKIAEFLKDGIDAAAEAEVAVGKLANQLRISGDFSQEALSQFTQFADSIERATGVTAELVLEQSGVAKAFGLSNEQTQKLIKAAIELSAVTGDTLDTSVQQLIKSYNGQSKALEATVSDVRGLTKEQLAAGAAIDLIADKFSGTAAKSFDTFSGSLKNAERAFGDIGEEVGRSVVNNTKLISLINKVAKAFDALVDTIANNSGTINAFIDEAVDAFLFLGKTASNIASIIERAIGFALLGVTGGIEAVLIGLEKLARLAKQTELAEGIEDARVRLSAFNKSLGESTVKGTNAFGKLATAVETVDKEISKVQKSAKATGDAISKASQNKKPFVDADELKKSLEDYKRFTNDIILATADETQKVNLKRQEQLDKLLEFKDKRIISDKEYTEQALKIEESYRVQITEINKRESEKRVKDQKAEIDEIKAAAAAAFANPIEYILKQAGVLDLNADPAKKGLTEGLSAGAGILVTALNGKEGAEKFAQLAGAGIADIFLPGFGQAIGPLIGELSKGRESTRESTKAFIESLDDILIGIVEGLFGLIEGLLFGLGEFGSQVLEPFFQKLADAFNKIGPGIRNGFLNFFAGLRDFSVDFFTALPKALGNFISGFGRAILNIFSQIGSGLSSIFSGFTSNLTSSLSSVLTNFVTGFGQVIADSFTAFLGLLESAIQGLGTLIQNTFGAIASTIGEALTSAFSALFTALNAIGDTLANAGKAVLDAIVNGLKSITDGIINAFKTVLDVIGQIFDPFVKAFNTIIDALKGITGGGSVGEKASSAGKKARKALGFAEGGLVPGGFPDDTFPARLTSGELVVPTNLVGALSDFLQSPQTGGQDMSVTNALLAKVIQKLDQPMTVSTTAELNGRTLADIILQLNRNNARLAG